MTVRSNELSKSEALNMIKRCECLNEVKRLRVEAPKPLITRRSLHQDRKQP